MISANDGPGRAWLRGHASRLLAAALVGCLCAAPAVGRAQQVEIVTSSSAGDRIRPKPALRFQQAGLRRSADFTIDTSVSHQAIAGFGATFLEAGMLCLNSLAPAQQESLLEALFDPVKGAGFSVMKTPIAATDFQSAGPWYSYDDTPGDVELRDFSIARDLGPNGVLTFIKRARRFGSFVLEAPMDYPPDWMLTDLVHRDRQDVDPRYFPVLARYYLRYLQEYERNGVSVDYLSLFNEPGIYTKIPYASIRELLAKHVGPAFERAGIRTRLCFAESEDRETAGAKFPTVLDDPVARKYAAVLMYHAYRLKSSRPIEDLRHRYPELAVWQSEVCHAYNAGTPRSMRLPRLDFDDGDFWGNLIVSDLEAGASAWLYWNTILDERGGPWLVSDVHEDPDPNVEQAVVHVNRADKRVTYTGLYYYLAHFSRFVRPGAVRVETRGSRPDVRCIAFRTPAGGAVAQLLNTRNQPATVRLAWRDRVLRVALSARSITTLRWEASETGGIGSATAQAGTTAGDPNELLGIWRGPSSCTDRLAAPACRDEDAVYEFTRGPRPGVVRWIADKMVDGKRQNMGESEVTYDGIEHCWKAEVTSPRLKSVWRMVVSGDRLTGTAQLLPGNETIRKLSLKRVVH